MKQQQIQEAFEDYGQVKSVDVSGGHTNYVPMNILGFTLSGFHQNLAI